MAYLTLIAAVPNEQVAAIRTDATYVLTPTLTKGVSHLLSYWLPEQPLGQILNSVIDDGSRLHKEFWHPLRPPMVHMPNELVHLTKSLKTEWSGISVSSTEHDEWLTSEMIRLFAVMDHGVETGAYLRIGN